MKPKMTPETLRITVRKWLAILAVFSLLLVTYDEFGFAESSVTTVEQWKNTIETDSDFNQIMNLSEKFISTMKSAYIQRGGDGFFQCVIGQIASKMGLENTDFLKMESEIREATAISFIHEISGQEVDKKIVSEYIKDFPDACSTSEQTATAIAGLIIDAYTLRKIGNSNSNVIFPFGNITNEEHQALEMAIGERFHKIKPRDSINLSGSSEKLRTNPLSRLFFGDKSDFFKTVEETLLVVPA